METLRKSVEHTLRDEKVREKLEDFRGGKPGETKPTSITVHKSDGTTVTIRPAKATS
jgi:hypothetical protein